MTRLDILEKARACVDGSREERYGTPERNFETIAEMWNAYLRGKLSGNDAVLMFTPRDVAAMLGLLKIARIAGGNYTSDSWVDLAGYAACGGEIDTERHEAKTND